MAALAVSLFNLCVAAVAQLVEPSVVVRVVVGSSPIGRPILFHISPNGDGTLEALVEHPYVLGVVVRVARGIESHRSPHSQEAFRI